MAKIVLDLHDIYNKDEKIDAELNRAIQEAVEKRIALVEIIPGKGSRTIEKAGDTFLRGSRRLRSFIIASRKTIKISAAFSSISSFRGEE